MTKKKNDSASPTVISDVKAEVLMPEVKTKAKEKPKVKKEHLPTESKAAPTTFAELFMARLEENGIKVNSGTYPTVIIAEDFVKHYSTMLTPSPGPNYAPQNFTANITAVVAKGQNTGLRLTIFKNVIRNALKEPLTMRGYNVNALVAGENDSRDIGIRKSELLIVMTANTNKRRRM